MVLDIPQERGLSSLDRRYLDGLEVLSPCPASALNAKGWGLALLHVGVTPELQAALAS